MAFAGTFIREIKRVIHGRSNLTTTTIHQQQQQIYSFPNNNDDDDTSSSDDSQPTNDNSNEYTEANYPGVLDSELTSLTITQRNVFMVTLTILFVLSMCGNTCTLFVNFRRKIRPFFRACLISLAFSDLMNTVFLTTAYLSQFTAEYVQIWRLGNLMCSLVPFATTCAILASSMTLVGIAVDRYFAVMKAVIGFWNPSIISCIVCMLCIWLASVGIASPVFTIYDLIQVYILTEEHETVNATGWPTTKIPTREVTATTSSSSSSSLTTNNGVVIMTSRKPNIMVSTITTTTAVATSIKSMLIETETSTGTKSPWEIEAAEHDLSYTLVREQKLVNMCVSAEKDVSLYYAIVFVIIFIPCIGAFIWFNSIIARKLWKRRHIAAITKEKTLRAKLKTKPKTTTTPPTAEAPKVEQTNCSVLPNKNFNCKSGQSSSTTVPSSLANTLIGKVSTPMPASGIQISTNSNCNTNNSREARHLRMFTIILLMMATFVFLRLPAWIFLLMRIYGSYTKPVHWILYFVFGLMNLASSVLNPLFYTFLTETIKYTLKFKAKMSSLFCGCYSQFCCCCYRIKYGTKNKNDRNTSLALHLENVDESWYNSKRCFESFRGCNNVLCVSLRCYQPHLKSDNKYNIHPHSTQTDDKNRLKESGHVINNDKDEGVDCNDEIDAEDVQNFYEYNHRIYTIFPPSLVSSSINSQIS
ncbi:uncharacterized protein ACRADG_010922 [Cochliomyia hominivorax]